MKLIASSIISKGQDPSGLKRWSQMTMLSNKLNITQYTQYIDLVKVL